MITNFLPKPNEIIEQSIMFNESMRAFGYGCNILIPENINLPQLGYHQDIGYDKVSTFRAYISIDPHPTPKLLQNLGWISEDQSTKPMVCYLSRYLQPADRPRDANSEFKEIHPTKYTKLLLDYDYNEEGKEFIVTEVTNNSFNPIYYIMKIVPYRINEPVNLEPLQDKNLHRLNVQQTDNELRFINVDRSEDVSIKY